MYWNRPVGLGCCPQPEPRPVCKVVNRCCYRDVCHVCPVHTHYVNKTIYRHHYVPRYTCSQENVCQDIHCGGCNYGC